MLPMLPSLATILPGEVRNPVLYGERYPSTIPQDYREERVPGIALGKVSVR